MNKIIAIVLMASMSSLIFADRPVVTRRTTTTVVETTKNPRFDDYEYDIDQNGNHYYTRRGPVNRAAKGVLTGTENVVEGAAEGTRSIVNSLIP